MKVVLISTLIAVLSIALASCEHGSKRTPSSSVEKEVSQFLKRLEIQARAQLEGEIRSVEVQARIYNERFLALKKRVDQRLSLLGKDGKQIRDQLNTETQKMVDAVNQEISKSVLEPKVLSLISSLRQYIGPIKSDFDDLIAAIKANPKNKKCWDENKCKIRSFINNILKETQNIIMGELNKLNKQVNDVVNSISDTVSKLENQLQIECSNKVSCYVDYVTFIYFLFR